MTVQTFRIIICPTCRIRCFQTGVCPVCHQVGEEEFPLCPQGCGIDLRDGWCPICRYQEVQR